MCSSDPGKHLWPFCCSLWIITFPFVSIWFCSSSSYLYSRCCIAECQGWCDNDNLFPDNLDIGVYLTDLIVKMWLENWYWITEPDARKELNFSYHLALPNYPTHKPCHQYHSQASKHSTSAWSLNSLPPEAAHSICGQLCWLWRSTMSPCSFYPLSQTLENKSACFSTRQPFWYIMTVYIIHQVIFPPH